MYTRVQGPEAAGQWLRKSVLSPHLHCPSLGLHPSAVNGVG